MTDAARFADHAISKSGPNMARQPAIGVSDMRGALW